MKIINLHDKILLYTLKKKLKNSFFQEWKLVDKTR